MDYASKKAALFVAHPGHVLRVYHWLEMAKPLVFVMTTGQGRDHGERLPSTSRLLESMGVRHGSVYGQWTDAQVYDAILNGDVDSFVTAAREIADDLVAEEIEYIVGDAAEGYQCTHELCRYVLNSAVILAEKKLGRSIPNYDFLLFGPPDACPEGMRDRAIRLDLDEAAFERKIHAAENYNPDFTHEVTIQIEKYGKKPFMVEYLMPSGMDAEWSSGKGKPLYEIYGELQVCKGTYQKVIRYEEHFRPMVEQLRSRLGIA